MSVSAAARLLQLQRNFSNLFEVSTLFLVACAIAIALKFESQAFVGLAWGFVALRFLHTLIHTTYNHLLHRALVF